MQEEIVFGWYLDGPSYPETCNGRLNCLGGQVIGPHGLANELALRLGIAITNQPQAIRIAKYMNAMTALNDRQQFYSSSFELDAWSTASYFLLSRDELLSSGWNGERIEGASPKLSALFSLEKQCFPLGSSAEIARAVYQTLLKRRALRLPIRSVSLVTPLQSLPVMWQRIFRLLESHGIKILELDIPGETTRHTDLAKVKGFLNSRIIEQLTGDGTFTLLEADDEYQLAETVVAWLQGNGFDLSKLVVIRDMPTTVLDGFCSSYGLPRLGGYRNSRWRSVLQVLPLMLQSSWLPANPYRTLEMLSMPDGPIPKNLGYFFIQALRLEPGFGGQRWKEAWIETERKLNAHSENDISVVSNKQERTNSILKHLHFWLEPMRFDPVSGMPATYIQKVCRETKKWAASTLRKNHNDELMTQVINTADELDRAIKISAIAHFTQLQLNRIIDAVYGEGCKPETWRAQSSPWSNVDCPGQLWSDVEHVLWWGFNKPEELFRQRPHWTVGELKALQAAGVFIESNEGPALRLAYSWRQAVLNTQRSILLCRSRVIRNEAADIHPFWDEVAKLVGDSSSIIQRSEKIISKEFSKLGMRSIHFKERDQQGPAKPRRIWHAPRESIEPRKSESVSSLRELLSCPLAWTLRYQAQLHEGILLTLPDGNRLIGDVAHKFFSSLLKEKQSDKSSTKLLEDLFESIVHSTGLPLLSNQLEYQRAKHQIILAFKQFENILLDAQLSVIDSEVRKSASFFDSEFVGDFDVLLEEQNGSKFIVDFKWNQHLKYRLEELQQNKHLQLIAYAWLESEGETAADWPRVGYYMLRQRRLIHSGGRERLEVGQEINTSEARLLWESIESAYLERMAELRSGQICATGIPEQNESLQCLSSRLFSLDPPCNTCIYGKVCGKAD